MKSIVRVDNAPPGHWVGDGFPVRTLFSYHTHAEVMSPFLLFDYAGPATFEASAKRRGVGEHPHRGFETVSIVYQGEVEHRDSSGGGGTIGPGDVQWMTAAGGILHDEFHSRQFTQSGGTLEMVQLWVNLPGKHKMAAPRYQTLTQGKIPTIELPNEAGQLRLIAGEYAGQTGPAQTFTPVNLWDVRLRKARSADFSVPEGHTLAVILLHGTMLANERTPVREAQIVIFERSGRRFTLDAQSDATFVVLSGAPIDEPVVGHGPFVMNTEPQILQAITDFNSGRFGHLAA